MKQRPGHWGREISSTISSSSAWAVPGQEAGQVRPVQHEHPGRRSNSTRGAFPESLTLTLRRRWLFQAVFTAAVPAEQMNDPVQQHVRRHMALADLSPRCAGAGALGHHSVCAGSYQRNPARTAL